MADVQRYDNYIDGQWVASDRYQANVNPSDLSDVIGEYAQADAAQVEQAIAAARRAAWGPPRTWPALSSSWPRTWATSLPGRPVASTAATP